MRFMVIVKASKQSEAGTLPSKQLIDAMGVFNEELIKAGVMLQGEGLHPSAKGARIRWSGGKRTIVDGPFSEAKELVAGYWLIQAKSREEAIEWMKRAPMGDDAELEIRQVFETSEFPDDIVSPEIRAQEEKFRDVQRKK